MTRTSAPAPPATRARVATGQFIGFMDNDIAVRSRGWLATLANVVLRENDAAGSLGRSWSSPSRRNISTQAPRSQRPGACLLGRGEHVDAPEHNVGARCRCLISACWLMKAAVPVQIGGLTRSSTPQFEDFDFLPRARCGPAVLYEPGAEMYHFNVTTDNSPDVNTSTLLSATGWSSNAAGACLRHEHGPPDSECRWAKLETRPIEQTGSAIID